jgi:hypothetical protein
LQFGESIITKNAADRRIASGIRLILEQALVKLRQANS